MVGARVAAGNRPAAWRRWLVLLALLVAAVPLLHAALPAHTGYVTDGARVLDEADERALAAQLQAVEQRTTAEIAVVTIASLDGLSIEEYANRLFHEWGIGQKGKDNGVLVLVAPSERRVRIEVGYGLEPVLPDGLAGEVIRNQALPAFRDGDVPGGIRATTARVAAIVLANQTLSAEERAALDAPHEEPLPTIFSTVFFGAFVLAGAASFGGSIRARAASGMIFGLLFMGIPLVLALIPFMNVTWPALAVVGAAGLVLGWRAARNPDWRAMMRGRSAVNEAGDSWVMGSAPSGSSSGGSDSSSSSGDFGGGDSGGGGASGSW